MRRGAVLAVLLLAGAAPATGQEWLGTRLCAAGLPRGGEFGAAVAVGEDGTIAVGAYLDDRVYLFRRDAAGNCQQLPPIPGPAAGEWFGFDLAIDGSRLLVGAPRSGGTGAAYLYDLGLSGVGNRRRITAPGAGPGDEVGSSIAIARERLAIGARGADDRRGRVYVGTEGALTAVPTPSGLAQRAELGQSVALSGSLLVMGAPSPFRGSGSPGAAYVVELGPGGSPSSTPVPLPVDPGLEAEAAFGYAVAVEGGRILVGAPLADRSGVDAGAVFAFDGVQDPEPDVVPVRSSRGDQLGVAVALDGETGTALIGARYANGTRGAAYLVRSGGSVLTLRSSQILVPVGAQLGFSVAIQADIAVVGAFREGGTGAAYVFERPPEPPEPTCQVPAGLSIVLADAPGQEEVRDLITFENGTPVRLGVRLTCRPDAAVAVTLRTRDATEGTVVSDRLTFTPETWDRRQTVEVVGQDDPDCDGDRVYRIEALTTSQDPAYHNLAVSISAKNADDELACLSALKEVCVDGDGTVVYTITLSNAGPRAPVTPAQLVDQLPGEVSVVTATADLGTATADPVANSVEWSGPVPSGEDAVTITIVAGLDPVPPGTEVRNQATVTYDRDGRGHIETVETNPTVFAAGETPCDSPPPP